MILVELKTKPKTRRNHGVSLVEAIVAMAIAGVAISALVGGFMFLLRRSEAGAYSVAANALALQGYERVRAAKWDALTFPNTDEAVWKTFPAFLRPGVGTSSLSTPPWYACSPVSLRQAFGAGQTPTAPPIVIGPSIETSMIRPSCLLPHQRSVCWRAEPGQISP